MTGLVPVPSLTVAGQTIAPGPGPGGVPAGLVALDGLSVSWGRSETLEHPDPPTGSAEIFDPSRTWATRQDLIGQVVTMAWSLTVNGATTARTFYRGRVSGVRVAPHSIALPGGGEQRGALVSLDLTSLLADLANITPSIEWPKEYVQDRTPRIATAAAAVVPGGISTRPPPGSFTTCRRIPTDDQVSIWQHIRDLYDSFMGDRIAYDPHAQSLSAVSRREVFSRSTLGRLRSDAAGSGTARAGKGVYAAARNLLPPGPTTTGLYLDSAGLEYDPADGITRDQTSRISRIQLTYPANERLLSDGTYINSQMLQQTSLVPGVDESINGVRELRHYSIWLSLPNTTLDGLLLLVQNDAASWQLEPVRMRTKTAPFEDLAQAVHLMSGGESQALVFLERSFLPELGVSPVFGVMGGRIDYLAGGWELEWNLAPLKLVAKQHAVAAEELDTATTRILAWDSPHADGFHESLTWEDLAWVGIGHGVADTGSWSATYNDWNYTP